MEFRGERSMFCLHPRFHNGIRRCVWRRRGEIPPRWQCFIWTGRGFKASPISVFVILLLLWCFSNPRALCTVSEIRGPGWGRGGRMRGCVYCVWDSLQLMTSGEEADWPGQRGEAISSISYTLLAVRVCLCVCVCKRECHVSSLSRIALQSSVSRTYYTHQG